MIGLGIFSKFNQDFETEEVAKLRASTILKGRVDDRDLDFGLALADQLDRELHAEMHAVHAARKEIARKIAACRKKPLGKLLRAASGSTRRPGVSLTRRERLAAELTGMTRATSVGKTAASKNGTLRILKVLEVSDVDKG